MTESERCEERERQTDRARERKREREGERERDRGGGGGGSACKIHRVMFTASMVTNSMKASFAPPNNDELY